MRQPEDVKELIAKIEHERLELLSDYQKEKDNNQQNIIAAILMEKSFCIKHLKWTIE